MISGPRTESDFPTPTTSELGLDAGPESAPTPGEDTFCETGAAEAESSAVDFQSTEDHSTGLVTTTANFQESTGFLSGTSSQFDWATVPESNFDPTAWLGTDSASQAASSDFEALFSDLPASESGDGDPLVNEGLSHAELTELWNMLLTCSNGGANPGDAGQVEQTSAVGVDPEKLAENIQKLLSGCAV